MEKVVLFLLIFSFISNSCNSACVPGQLEAVERELSSSVINYPTIDPIKVEQKLTQLADAICSGCNQPDPLICSGQLLQLCDDFGHQVNCFVLGIDLEQCIHPEQLSPFGISCNQIRRNMTIFISELVHTYAPRIWLSKGELYLPMDIDSYLAHFSEAGPFDQIIINGPLTRYSLGSFGFGNYYLKNLIPWGCEYCIDPEIPSWATGNSLSSHPPVYALVVPKLEGWDIYYFSFFGFTVGKKAPSELLCNCLLGGHQAGWEYIGIRLDFSTFEPKQIVFPRSSNFSGPFNWTDSQLSFFNSTHPEIFSANGTHHFYPWPKNYIEVETINLFSTTFTFSDTTNRGTSWDTWENVEIYTYDTLEEDFGYNGGWIDYMGLWGSKESGCIDLAGERIACRVEDSPRGPLDYSLLSHTL